MSLNKVAILLILTLAITACSKKSTEQYIADAQAYLANEEVERAVIELKSAIVGAPRDIESRLLLGETYFQLSQFANAEKELETAKDLGATEENYFLLLVASQYYQNNFEEAQLTSEKYKGADPEIKSLARLYGYLSAIRIDDTPPSLPSELQKNALIVAQANQALIARRPSRAIELTQQIDIKNSFEKVEVGIVRGIALMSLGRLEEAEQTYEKIVDFFPYYYFARFQLIEIQTQLNLLDKARENLTFLFEIKPDSALTHYYSAMVHFKQNEFEKAFQAATLADSANISDIELNFVAGVSAYKIGKIESAYNFLNKNKNKVPSNHISNKILAEVSLKLGYAVEVIAEIGGLQLHSNSQAIVFSSAAIQEFQLGNFNQAIEYIEQAKQASPEDPVVLLREGLMKLSVNDQSGIDSLAKSIEYDESIDESWLLLAEAYLRSGENQAAIALAKKWQERNKIDGMNLEGYLRLKMGELPEATNIFMSILEQEPEHSGATRYLMLIHAQNGEFVEAKNFAAQLVKQNPKSLANLISYVNLFLGSNDANSAEAFLTEQIEANPKNQEAIVAKSMLLSWDKKYDDALDLLIKKGDPSRDLIQKTKGDLYSFLRRYDKAIDEYTAWLKKDFRNPDAWFKKIQAVRDKGSVEQGLLTTTDALKYFPNDPRLIGMRAHFLILNGKISEAKKVMQDLTEFEDKLPIVNYYKGHIALEEGQYQTAYDLINEFYQFDPNFETATLLSRALEGLNRPEEGLAALQREIAKIPRPLLERHVIAEYMARNGMYDKAIEYYHLLLKDYPTDFITVNNYASVLTKAGKLTRAEELANIGLKMIPTSPYAMDTLGRVFFEQGKIKEALFYIEKAHKAVPQNAEIQLHLAETLLADNQVNRAKILINRVKPVTKIEKDLLADIKATL